MKEPHCKNDIIMIIIIYSGDMNELNPFLAWAGFGK